MSVNAGVLKTLIDDALAGLSDDRVIAHIRGLLVEPRIVFRNWNYGKPGDRYPCWAVLDDREAGTGIAYCEIGFGPRLAWGLVWLEGNEHDLSMGMDSGWFPTFIDAYFESPSAAALPIWRVFKTDPSGIRRPITGESSWDTTWELVAGYRNADPASRYDCDHSIPVKR